MLALWVRREDYTLESSWGLLAWCLARGADEFGLTFLGPPDPAPAAWAEIDAVLARFVRSDADGDARYALNPESAEALRCLLADGLFTYEPGETSIEDPTVYRAGAALLSVITHEGEGVLALRPEEQAGLDVAGLPYHLRSRWG